MRKNNSPKVSIIIPVYNASKEMFEISISSVLNQTYENLDVVVVDDGSTNGIQNYCDELKNRDNRIRVIHQKNQGVSAARNKGTEEAVGDYVMYVDADDIATDSMVECAVGSAIKNDSDLVMGLRQKIWQYSDFKAHKTKEEYLIDNPEKKDIIKEMVFHIDENKILFKEKLDGNIGRESYGKLIKTQLAKKSKFPIGVLYGEDLIWLMRLLKICDKICIKNSIWYGYLQYNQSSVFRYNEKRAEGFDLFNALLKGENEEFLKKFPYVMPWFVYTEIVILIHYQFSAKECSLSFRERNKQLRNIISKYERDILCEPEYQKSIRLRMILLICKTGLWIPLSKMRGL